MGSSRTVLGLECVVLEQRRDSQKMCLCALQLVNKCGNFLRGFHTRLFKHMNVQERQSAAKQFWVFYVKQPVKSEAGSDSRNDT